MTKSKVPWNTGVELVDHARSCPQTVEQSVDGFEETARQWRRRLPRKCEKREAGMSLGRRWGAMSLNLVTRAFYLERCQFDPEVKKAAGATGIAAQRQRLEPSSIL